MVSDYTLVYTVSNNLNISVGSTAKNDKCIPFVSQYTDCTVENQCSGCKKCLCMGSGKWSCEDVQNCPADESEDANEVDEQQIDEALDNIERDMEKEVRHESYNAKSPLVPAPMKKGKDDVLLDADDFIKSRDVNIMTNIDADLVKLLGRRKRSIDATVNKTKDNIKFYHTVDEINEDLLKNNNKSGTIQAKRVINLPKASRRVGVSDNESLHIEFSEPKPYDPHITDNKIETSGHIEDTYVKQENNKINAFLGNHTMKTKDKELSKLIVNELNNGAEVIGDKSAPIVSNVTFTPENDTLTAMAFIAGNLLNQLWDMEKDSNEGSRETEDLKHEKIEDLLDLFKEPLNIRQEKFLKSALEHLSAAIDKDKVLKDVTLCEARRLIGDMNGSNEDKKNDTVKLNEDRTDNLKENEGLKKEVATQAISKVGDVLNLMEKFQQVQNSLNSLKHTNKHDKVKSKVPEDKPTLKTALTRDETVSLNVFGKLLEKITKLLLPHKKYKKMVKTIKNQNIFAESSQLAQKLKNSYGIDVGNSTLTAKDKIALDYLNIIKANPKCKFHTSQDFSSTVPNVEGDILLNLSQFFKIKSIVDLLKLLENEKKSIRSRDNTDKPEENTIPTTTPEIVLTTLPSKLTKTKERLKDHIKSIIDDLRELQVAKGFPASNITIADALPCIYNIMNDETKQKNKLPKKNSLFHVERVSTIFNALKRDLLAVPTRRTNTIPEIRPKSAVVWERIIKNFDNKSKKNNRRSMNEKELKSIEDLNKMIKVLGLSSKTYKNQVIAKGLTPSKRLVLLKTLNEEVRKYLEVLENIKLLLPTLKTLPLEKQNDLRDFVFNAAMNINLNSKVAKSMSRVEPHNNNMADVEIISPRREKVIKENHVRKQSAKTFEIASKAIKLTRDEIINQLIKNRMLAYIRVKESKGQGDVTDVNYVLAKKILHYLEMGNYSLARELYKYIIGTEKERIKEVSKEYTTAASRNKYFYGFPKEPLLQFEEPTTPNQLANHKSWFKQLMNLKKI